MSTSGAPHHTYTFGEFTLDVDRGALLSDGADIRLRPKSFEVLCYLVVRHGRLVTRDELLGAIWTKTVVTEDAVTQCLIDVRKAIGDRSQAMIRTVPRRGYIFDLPVIEHGSPVEIAQPPAEETTRSPWHGWRAAAAITALLGAIAASIYLVPVDRAAEGQRPDASEVTALSDDRIRIAVLPLDNYSGDPDQEYFSDGLTEELIAQLAGLQSDRLGVIARTSVMHYKGKNKRIDEIGRELSLDFVLEGSVRRSGDRVRISAQLIQVSDQTHLWAQSFERDLDDIFALQIDVAERVMRTLALELLPSARVQMQRSSPTNLAAYEAYLKGRFHESRGGPDGLLRAIEHYDEAIRHDPGYALAYAAVGHVHGVRGMLGYTPFAEGNSRFWDYNLKAAELDPGLAEVQVNFADFKFYGDWNWSEGEAGFRRAFEKDPDSENVVWHYALCLHLLGRYEEASGVLERALHLDPFSRRLNNVLIGVYLDSRQHDRAIEQYQQMIDWEPGDAGIYSSYGNALADMGRDDDAVEAYLKARYLAGDSADQLQALRNAYTASGLRGYWEKRFEQLMATGEDLPIVGFDRLYAALGKDHQALSWLHNVAESRFVSPVTFAGIYTRLADTDQALRYLEEAYSERNILLAWLKVDRQWDPLRDDPRFQDLMRRMSFPE